MANPIETEPKPADPYARTAENDEAILALVKRKKEDFSKGRDQHIRATYRNLLFMQGQQWIRYDGALGRFRPAALKPGTPTPVTNLFASSMDAVISVFARIEPRLNFAPGNPEEPEDRAAADVATRAIQVIEAETNLRVNRQMLAAWVGMAGGAWLETGYDPDTMHGTRELQVEQCSGPRCGIMRAPALHVEPPVPPALPCDVCGAPVFAKTETVPIGKMYVDVVSLFEMFFDPSITDWSKQRAVIREQTSSKDEAEARWPDFKEKIVTDVVGSGGVSEWYAGALTTIGPELDASTTARMMRQGQGPLQNRVTEQWYWQLPDATYPKGLLAIVLSRAHVVFAGPLPYARRRQDGGRQPFLPFTFFPQKLVPGSAFPKTVANDLAPKQAQRNKWESILESCGMRMGSPIWMVPNAANVASFSGDPGFVGRYNAAQGLPDPSRWRLSGQGIPLSFIQRVTMFDKEFEELAACLTGDQEIPCLDGTTRTMEELARDYPDGGGMWVYGFDREQMRVVPAQIQSAWKSGTKRCVRVSFKEGTHVDCSFDHPFLTYDRGYVWAEDLRADEAIVPLVLHEADDYLSVAQPVDRKDEPVHRMVAHALLGLERGGGKRDVHHRDHNGRNNLPGNLEVLTRSEHIRRHPETYAHLVGPRDANNRTIQGTYSRSQWAALTPEERRARVAPMLAGRRKQLDDMTPEQRSQVQRDRWAKIPKAQRTEIAEKVVRRRPSKNPKIAAHRRAYWAAKPPEERQALAAKMREGRMNHRVASVVEIGDREVYDLQTGTGNFGTGAGVFVHNSFDVIKGARPVGVSAGIALQLLQERAMSRFSPQFILWEQAHAEWAGQAIEIFREFATEERMLRIKGRDGAWEVQKFLGADLAGRVDVIPEAGSAMPHSTMVERAEIEQLIALGILNAQDPDTNDEILKRYGKSYMKPSMARDTKNAIMENEAFEVLAADPRIAQATADDVAAAREMDYPMLMAALESKGVKVPRVRGAVDDHSVHSREHGQCLKSEKVRRWPELVQVIFEAHKAFHDTLRIQQMTVLQGLAQNTNATAGFLQPPPAMSQTLNTSSSPARMEGDFDEMAQDVGAGSA